MQAMQRTAFTYLAYISLGYFGYLLVISPSIEYLGQELNISKSLFGLHFAAFALGIILAGSLSEFLAKRYGRPFTFWFGGAGMSLGALGLTLAQSVFLTIPSAFVMGLLGGNLLIMVQATLADEFGERRTVALTESNVIAVIFQTLMPTVVYLAVSYFGNWRYALWSGIVFGILIFVFGRNIPFPSESQKSKAADKDTPLPSVFWLFCLVMAFGVAAEWAITAWTIKFFNEHLQFSQENATLMLSVFSGAMLVGRVVGSWLSHRYDALVLLLAAQILALVAFPFVWLGSHPLINSIGLFVLGLGIANMYPLSFSVLARIGKDQANKASARASQAVGIAMLGAPLLLGVIGESLGIFNAYGIGMVFLALLPIIVGVTRKKI